MGTTSSKANPNMKIWNAVEKTPVGHTKKVNIGRGFTAIDAQYCIMKATETFGPVGEGWGWNSHSVMYPDNNIIACEVTVWQGSQANTYGPYLSLAPIKDKNGRLDSDAAKKAITDALTKCLSHLGIGADVFLGKYDDNKYIAQLRKEESERIKEQYSVADHVDPDLEAQEREVERKIAASLGDDL